MAEVILQFDPPLTDEFGVTYVVKVCGRAAEDGLWEGWIEFDPQNGGRTLRTPRETEQPNRGDLEYWATGLTVTYLEGALERALNPRKPDLRSRSAAIRPTYDRPAPTSSGHPNPSERVHPRAHAVLDPFEVYAQGEGVLRAELRALDEDHLRNIIRAHTLVNEKEMDLLATHRTTLAEMIVAAVRARVG